MTSLDNGLSKLLLRLRQDYPQFKFKPGPVDTWSSEEQTIFYSKDRDRKEQRWSLLHELAHAILGHDQYFSDFELLKLESKAWSLAKELGDKYKIKIDEQHIQHCLDTYRDWLHRRSTCPTCDIRTLQTDEHRYACHNCGTIWTVTTERFVRPYRLKQKLPTKE